MAELSPQVLAELGSIGPVVLKIERAKKHVLDLEEALNAFFRAHPYGIRYKDDLNTRQRSYCLASARDVPINMLLIAGDAIHNLRSALDHVAHLLVVVGKGSPGPFAHVSFPIFETVAKYKAGRAGRIQGMRQDAIEAIDTIEPYGGGKGEVFYHLHCLNNIDKHRVILTAFADLVAHSILPSQRKKIYEIHRRSHPGGTPPDLGDTLIPPSNKQFPLRVGDVFLTIPESELEQKMTLKLDIAFGEPKVVEGKRVVETLHQMTNRIRAIVFDFDRMGLFA